MYCNLKMEMLRRKMSVEALAEILKITPSLLRRKITGFTEFNLEETEIILRLFPHHSFDYLFQSPTRSIKNGLKQNY
ncbi:MAG: helix-turn-helix transcriptional regulator [Candidatus Izemoplasmatales bacterium]|nr:helix-turn-helix transcriptional regulator [Candidatus Izemoplasmatales bacterium]